MTTDMWQMSQLILLSFVVVLDTDHHRVLIPRLENLAQGDGIALEQFPFTLSWSSPESGDGQLFLSAWGCSAVNSLRDHSCFFSCSTFIWSLWKFVRQFGKIIILGTLSGFQLTQKPWLLGLTSTDRKNVLAKSQLAESLPQKYGKDGDQQI